MDNAVADTLVSKLEESDGIGDYRISTSEGMNEVVNNGQFLVEVNNYCGCGSQTMCSERRSSRNRSRACKDEKLFLSFARKKRGTSSKRCRKNMWGSIGISTQLDRSQCQINGDLNRKEGNVCRNGFVLPPIRLKVKLGGDDKKNIYKPNAFESDCTTENDNHAKNNSDVDIEGKGTFVGEVNLATKNSNTTFLSSASIVEIDTKFSEITPFEIGNEHRGADATSPDSEVSNSLPKVPLTGKSNGLNGSKIKPPKKREGRTKGVAASCFSGAFTSSISGSSNSLSSKELSQENASVRDEVNDSKEEEGADVLTSTSLDDDIKRSYCRESENPVALAKAKGQSRKKSVAGSKKRKPAPNKSKPRNRKRNGTKKKENESKSTSRSKLKDKDSSILNGVEDYSESGQDVAHETGAKICIHTETLASVVDVSVTSSVLTDQCSSNDNAWVRCDNCHKWRRISEELADSIGQSNCRWICGDNLDKLFADCSVPQEMSNSEINAELGISDTDADGFDAFSNSMTSECSNTADSKENEFVRISNNQFLHRNRKSQSIDEIMVCGCKAPVDGGPGCQDGCLNRMLNIECIPGTCPSGDLCSNQQFQKRSYANMKWARCGKKGYGLRLVEDISRGQFLIEYVGEVLDMRTYQARLKEYASLGHKHFYFMTLDGSEVIDACAKGNLGRFINHSCDPNCRTEKWVVNGEICIGLFAVRDIKKGEELTFDYNYVRVVGAAAKRCYCGSLQCRGYIGGDPANADFIDQVDSDEEFPEPIMLDEDDEFKTIRFGSDATDSGEEILGSGGDSFGKLTLPAENIESISGINSSHKKSAEILPDENVTKKDHGAQPEAIAERTTTNSLFTSTSTDVLAESKQCNQSSDAMVSKRSKSASVGEKRVFVKSRFYIKTADQTCILKRGKPNVTNLRKPQTSKGESVTCKPKKLIEAVANGRFEAAVEEKLNELLDVDGGISKRKESPKGYLQLLHLTAASGSNGTGETIQSNRDLSLLLDAILKTKSRAVLNDIIQKNVLQKLHNMVKQCRRDFKRMPILRKVLKVLEYLAIKEVLTLEHICKGPPHPGVESFIESMLSLTDHDDKQVHQIARNFRDKWIPRHARKICFLDRDDERKRYPNGSNAHFSERAVKVFDKMPATNAPRRTRKRKTRWDQDKPVFVTGNGDDPAEKCDPKPLLKRPLGDINEDVPPGFSSVLAKDHCAAPDLAVGKPQKKFLSRLPVSYGIPVSAVQRFGTPKGDDGWVVAPGVAFSPFPPLPSSPRPYREDVGVPEGNPSTSGASRNCCEGMASRSKRPRDSMHDIGRTYFRQQKWKRAGPLVRDGTHWDLGSETVVSCTNHPAQQ